jgi:hypothetical protein
MSSCAVADSARLDLPSFRHLEHKAVSAVDFDFGRWAIGPASWLVGHDEDGRELKELLNGIQSVRVRSYEFKRDYMYSKSDIDDVRRQLASSGWRSVMQIRERDSDEKVDMFLAIDGDRPVGFALIASGPREFTIVNVVGDIDLDSARRLSSRFRSTRRVIVADSH